jgi:hypothetical protein
MTKVGRSPVLEPWTALSRCAAARVQALEPRDAVLDESIDRDRDVWPGGRDGSW